MVSLSLHKGGKRKRNRVFLTSTTTPTNARISHTLFSLSALIAWSLRNLPRCPLGRAVRLCWPPCRKKGAKSHAPLDASQILCLARDYKKRGSMRAYKKRIDQLRRCYWLAPCQRRGRLTERKRLVHNGLCRCCVFWVFLIAGRLLVRGSSVHGRGLSERKPCPRWCRCRRVQTHTHHEIGLIRSAHPGAGSATPLLGVRRTRTSDKDAKQEKEKRVKKETATARSPLSEPPPIPLLFFSCCKRSQNKGVKRRRATSDIKRNKRDIASVFWAKQRCG